MGTVLMTHKNNQNTRGAAIARAIMEKYQPQTREEMQDAVKDVFGPMFEAMLQGEIDFHLGYGRNERGKKKRQTGVMVILISLSILFMESWMLPFQGIGMADLNRK